MQLSQSMQTVAIVGAYLVFSTAVSSLSPPTATSHPFYEWFYKFANGLSANITAIRGKAAFEPKPDLQIVETKTAAVTTEPKL